MKNLITILFRWFTVDLAQDVIRHLIAKYLPGYHLHRDPVRKPGLEELDKEIEAYSLPEVRRQAD